MQTKTLYYRHFHVSQVDQLTVVELVDPSLVDYLLVDEMTAELHDFYLALRPQSVLVDWSQVRSTSTSSINGLLQLRNRLRADGGQLKLCNMNAAVREKYRSLNLDGRVFEIFESQADALATF